MKLRYFILALSLTSFSCQNERSTSTVNPFFGHIKSIEVHSFELTKEGENFNTKEIVDSLPSWIPVEEYGLFFTENRKIHKEYIGTPYNDGSPDTLTHQYDDSNRLFETIRRSSIANNNSKTRRMYNRHGKIDAINVFSATEELDSVFLYNYDSEGTLRSINEFHNAKDYEDFVASLVKKYFYTVKNMLRIDFYPKNPHTGKHYYAKRITQKFRKNGQLFEEKIESGGTTKNIYEYDSSNQLVSIHTYDDFDQLIAKTNYEYDEYGNIMLKKHQSGVDSYSYRCDYEYDDKNNWIDKRIFISDNDLPSYQVKREIQYY